MRATPQIQIPGAPEAAAPKGTDALADAIPADARAAEIRAKDAEIAMLRAQLGVHNAAKPTADAVLEQLGPNAKRYRAESKHLHFTSAELHAKVKAGEIHLTDHHVLCSDGWYTNPNVDR